MYVGTLFSACGVQMHLTCCCEALKHGMGLLLYLVASTDCNCRDIAM